MNIKDLKDRSIKDLNGLLAEQREGLRGLRFKVSNRQLKNVRELRLVRKTISRILTLLNH